MRRGIAAWTLALLIGLGLGSKRALAQAPTVPQEHAMPVPGSTGSLLGPAPGAGAVPFESAPGAGVNVLGGRPGTESPRVPTSITSPPAMQPQAPRRGIAPPAPLPIRPLPMSGPLEAPAGPLETGPPSAITLDQAIDRLLHKNLFLLSRYYEIPQAEADILTASLRANPLFYADTQLAPFGQYSNARPGGPLQYDVNATLPIDITHKRIARMIVAQRAKNVLEAQYQDAARLQIQNLYMAWVDLLAAREQVNFRRRSLEGYREVLKVTSRFFEKSGTPSSDVKRAKIELETTEVLFSEDEESLRRAQRALGTLLNFSPADSERIEVHDTIADLAPLPPDSEELLQIALGARPDIVAYRLGVARAEADVKLAKANRMQDVYWLVQPYTFQNNQPFGLKSATSWATGITVPFPFFNRNQGNIQRSLLNVSQSQIEEWDIERKVATEVRQAAQDYIVSRNAALRFQNNIVPAARAMRDDVRKFFVGGETDIVIYLRANREYFDYVRQYRDLVVLHRRSMLNLNTAVGQRILP